MNGMRLMGLPNAKRYPEATVLREEEHIQLLFSGPDGGQSMNVPLKYVAADAEEAELMLLAQLQQMGYNVRRGS